MRTFILATAITVLVGVACKKEEETKAPAPAPVAKAPPAVESAKPPAAPTPVAAEGQPGQNRMQHCPTAAPNATTTIADSKDGVVISIVAADPKNKAVVDDVRQRARHTAEVATKDSTDISHSGAGTGGGGMGRCPVITQDTKLVVDDIDGGVKIAIVPNDAAGLVALRQEVRDRQKEFSSQGTGGLGSANP